MNKKLISYVLAIIFISFSATTVFADAGGMSNNLDGKYLSCPSAQGTTLCNIMDDLIQYFDWALVLLMGFAVLMFTWYVIQYYVKPNEDRKNAGQYVMYSVIGFFVILSLWGLVNVLSNTFGGLDNNANSLPAFPLR